MKLRMSLLVIIATLFCVELTSPARLSAQSPRYKVIDLGTSGGPQSYLNLPDQGYYARILNNSGAVAGYADTKRIDPFSPGFCFAPDCQVSHAFQWQNGVRTDLRELDPRLSSQANWISANGLIAGFSENGEIDPLFTGFPEFRGVLWENGKITDLGTLPEGGYESVANAVNSSGQVVGVALNTIPDSFSMLFGTTQTRAFLWQNGVMQDLGTLGGTDAAALLVNDLGQVVGDSYTSSNPSAYCTNIGFPLTTGAFIWHDGKMEDLGNFGGTCTFASDLNNLGQVVGGSTLPQDKKQHPFLWQGGVLKDLGTFGGKFGNAIAISDTGEVVGWASLSGDQFQHAFLWDEGVMTDLGTLSTLPEFVDSFAVDANASGQIVGFLTDSQHANFHAFVWQEGRMFDLEALIVSSGLQLGFGVTNINDLGEIAGNATDANGNSHAVLLVPCDANDSTCPDAAASATFTPAPATTTPTNNLNNAMKRVLRGRLAPLYQIPPATTSSGPQASAGTSETGSNSATAILWPSASLSPTSLRFLCRPAIDIVCGCLTRRTTTLTNLGSANLSIKSISTTGAFSQTNNCGTSLGAGESCAISVLWSPLNNSAGLIDVSDNAPGSPQTVSLSGYKACNPLTP